VESNGDAFMFGTTYCYRNELGGFTCMAFDIGGRKLEAENWKLPG
jgi:hypothetical protein